LSRETIVSEDTEVCKRCKRELVFPWVRDAYGELYQSSFGECPNQDIHEEESDIFNDWMDLSY
jgi:hypothetical protein